MIARLARTASLVLGLFIAAATAAPADEPMRLAPDPAPLVIETEGGPVSFTVEIADTPEERARGLMFRTDLPADRAMLFDFGAPRPVTMWMKNTPLALDMLFADAEGRIIRVTEATVPFSLDTLASGGPVLFVVEVRAGVAARHGIAAGARLSHPVVMAGRDG